MTYFGFLLRFLVVPILLLLIVVVSARRRGKRLPDTLRGLPFVAALLGHIIVALLYTTPWDNYLVATGVWYYNPALVTGITIGWVPIEEYTFFLLQPVLVGLWLYLLATTLDLRPSGHVARPRLRWGSVLVVGAIWLAAVAAFLADWAAAQYLSIILAWALFPVLIQLAMGADILWRYRKLVFWTLAPATLYLAVADALAIGAGTWTIDPAQSFHVLISGVLPVEEFVFFFMTNVLLVFGMTLVLARESHDRLHHEIRPWLAARSARARIDAEQ